METTPAFSIYHAKVGGQFYHLENAVKETWAVRRANNYALDHGGYVCVKNRDGETIFGTDPAALARATGAA
jgi:hypothetical protein